jgi:hypothetical protein
MTDVRSQPQAPFAGPTENGDPRVADVRKRLNAAHAASATPPQKAAAKLESQNKLYVRDRIALLFDEGSFVEDGRFANAMSTGLPADGVVTGRGTVDGRPAIVTTAAAVAKSPAAVALAPPTVAPLVAAAAPRPAARPVARPTLRPAALLAPTAPAPMSSRRQARRSSSCFFRPTPS